VQGMGHLGKIKCDKNLFGRRQRGDLQAVSSHRQECMEWPFGSCLEIGTTDCSALMLNFEFCHVWRNQTDLIYVRRKQDWQLVVLKVSVFTG